MTAGVVDLAVQQGATFHRAVIWQDLYAPGSSGLTPRDLTGCTARLVVGPGWGSDAPAMLTLTEVAGLTLGGTSGTISIDVNAAQTSALERGGIYALVVSFPDGLVVRLLQGDFRLSR